MAAVCLQRHNATDMFAFVVAVVLKSCILATPGRSNMRAAPGAGAIHPGVPPAHGRQHRTQIKSTATAPFTFQLKLPIQSRHMYTHIQTPRHTWLLRKRRQDTTHQTQREHDSLEF